MTSLSGINLKFKNILYPSFCFSLASTVMTFPTSVPICLSDSLFHYLCDYNTERTDIGYKKRHQQISSQNCNDISLKAASNSIDLWDLIRIVNETEKNVQPPLSRKTSINDPTNILEGSTQQPSKKGRFACPTN